MAGSICCDLGKAFDSVNHDILLSNYRNMELMIRLNYYLNLIFRIDIKEFKSLTLILIQTQFQNGLK